MAKIKKDIQGSHNELVIAGGIAGRGRVNISVHGQNNRVVIEKGIVVSKKLNVQIQGDGCHVTVRENTSFAGTTLHADGYNLRITIGSDCMFSSDIHLLTSDSHSIFSRVSGELVNRPEDILVGDHVWVGLKALIMKGCRIGSGSVIAAGSIVTKDVPDGAIVGGNPARPIAENIAWNRVNCIAGEAAPLLDEEVYGVVDDAEAQRTSVEFYPTERDKRVQGWAAQLGVDNEPSRIHLVACLKNGELRRFQAYKCRRSDVARQFKDDRLLYVGFVCYLPADYPVGEIEWIRFFVICQGRVTSNTIVLR